MFVMLFENAASRKVFIISINWSNPPVKEGFLSQIVLVPKKNGGYELVVNLKTLNKFVAEELFEMEGFHMVKDLVKPGSG